MNRNPNGTFMNADEIFEDIVANRLSDDIIRLLETNFEGEVDEETGINFGGFIYSEFGRWIRNSYGLWDETNPYTMNDGPDLRIEHNVIVDPRHADNFSGAIIDRLVEHFKK